MSGERGRGNEEKKGMNGKRKEMRMKGNGRNGIYMGANREVD